MSNPRKLSIVIILVVLFGTRYTAHGSEKESGPIGELAYSIMFDSLPQIQKINELIKLCSKKSTEYAFKLPSRDEALGVLIFTRFPVPSDRLAEIITAPHKEQIYKSSCRVYFSDLPIDRRNAFLLDPEDTVHFTGHYEVVGKFCTEFTYNMQTEWLKSGGWLLERGYTLPGVKRTKGMDGYINHIHSFTILVALNNSLTLKVSASWDDIGGKLPIIGEIHASYNDIIEALRKADDDIRDYFKIQNEDFVYQPFYDKISN